ncbi:2-amino-4-hydroxy-6-hydroxymethyldihydropteridine diphosphokinase [Echinicola marina]|uniref:2-amino-4-hydroxy-6- hydroxymethyldihydropteridine diphosphokinase n=1 Tax=Echinicola marina TaxID=2859768 RepID=UPI001CF62F97|nr:2-amino-4-hydroxy-6-hydroxymethyldihydropteridine diphosphokinase [Echinicola marina]UCS93123.1 2-amino-4-hydroxy-6-hydroxymethyldihydropteridine diphosphokinase [Echinicola marina]
MEKVVLLIGGNLADREALLKEAVLELGRQFEIIKLSGIYETAAWGGKSSGDYLNMAVLFSTDKPAEEVLDIVLAIENQLGRERDIKWGNRTMDIDIIYFGDQVIDTERLNVPHPMMSGRKFVLIPLAEILPDFVHPKLKVTNQELLEKCPDVSEVKYFSASLF